MEVYFNYVVFEGVFYYWYIDEGDDDMFVYIKFLLFGCSVSIFI